MDSANDLKKRLAPLVDCLRGNFTLASGKQSDFYFNGKTTTLRPEALNLAARLFLDLIAPEKVDRVGGLTLGADALVGAITALSWEVGRPVEGFIVRKEPKGHGTGQWIEGPEIKAGARVAVVEDVVTSGGSSLKTVERIKAVQPDCTIVGVYTLVDREEGGCEALAAAGLPLKSVFTKAELFKVLGWA